MPENCNGFVEWVTWKRTSDATYTTTLKDPAGAPEPTKPIPDRLRGLNEEADADAARRSEPHGDCPTPCQNAQPVVTTTNLPNVIVEYRWTEQYDLTDAGGNTVRLTAKYTAVGKADFQKLRHRAECYPDHFGNIYYNLNDIEVKVPAKLLVACSPEQLYLALQREGLLEKVEEILG